MPQKIIFIDPGHGGTDPGATGHDLKEKDLTLVIAKKVRKILHSHWDCDVRLSRSQDKTVSLNNRTRTANAIGSDCLVSIHINAANDDGANGFESFVYTTDGPGTKSADLQDKLHSRLAKLWAGEKRRDRGQKKDNFHMVREFRGAAVLLELGFISNLTDARLLKNDDFLGENAATIADAIADHLNLPANVSETEEIYRVLVDGKQTGAYGKYSNILNAVGKALKAGADDIKLSKINQGG